MSFDGLKHEQILQACQKDAFPFWWYLGKRYALGCKESDTVVIEKSPQKAIECLEKQLTLIPTGHRDAFTISVLCHDCLSTVYDEVQEYDMSILHLRSAMALMKERLSTVLTNWGSNGKDLWFGCCDKMAQCYYYGKGVVVDKQLSFKIYADLVREMEAIGYYGWKYNDYKLNFARYYLYGVGVAKDPEKALGVLSMLKRPSAGLLRFVDQVALLVHGHQVALGNMTFDPIK